MAIRIVLSSLDQEQAQRLIQAFKAGELDEIGATAVEVDEKCPRCQGSGYSPSSHTYPAPVCYKCNGSKVVQRRIER